MHGGNTHAAGANHPNYKTGRYSKAPEAGGLLAKVAELANDENLLNLRTEAALMMHRLHELMEKQAATDYEAVKELQVEYDAVMDALQESRFEDANKSLEAMGKLIKRASSTAAVWREIDRVVERRRRVVTSEQNTMLKQGQLITVAQAVHAMNSLVAVVSEHGKENPAMVREITRKFALLTGMEPNVEVIEISQ